ncbi:hypothetical protein ACH4VR_19480 [Streptomyces sp. NPDC020883]|uniref:hypothetical protein n=1 Tax=Streptomyces sp. NPDC020883 TaxID=3365099 RepID=UPI0037B8EE1C
MPNFLDLQVDARRLAQLLADLDRRLKDLERTTQAGYTSIEGGAIDIYDAEGQLRGSVGVQPDGTVGLVPHNASPPPTPTAPKLEPVLAGLLVTWDGAWENAYDPPLDLAGIQVHMGTAEDFTPDQSTLVGTISDVQGATITVATADYATVWIRLVAVNTTQVTGPPSPAVKGTPRQVDAPDLSALVDLAQWLKDESVPGTKLVRETIGADLLAANAVTAGKIDAGTITGREIKAQSIEGTHIKAGALEATHIKAGSINADLIAADALNGKTITGATVQTGTTGARITLDTSMRLYDAKGEIAAEAKLADGTTDVGFAAYNTSGFGRYYAMLSRGYVRFGKEGTSYRGVPGADHTLAGDIVSTLALSSGNAEDYGQARFLLTAGTSQRRPKAELSSDALGGRADLVVNGIISSGNVVTGTIAVTPSKAGIPQSATITGLNITGTTFRAWVSPMSSVPGTSLLGCTATNVTSTGMTIWLTRKDLVLTTIHWMIIGS